MWSRTSNMRNYIFGFNTGIQFRIGYQSQAKSSLEQGQVSGGPAAHPHQNFCLVPPPRHLRLDCDRKYRARIGHISHMNRKHRT